MSRKKTLLAALLCAAVTLCACARNEGPSNESEDKKNTSGSTSSTSSESSASSSAGGAPFGTPGVNELPRMDGSTSAVPLEIGLRSGLFDIPYSQAKELVSHTTTHDSFKRLIKGEVDLIFSVPISEEQRKMADEAGVELIMEPVAREGFVFVVNAENPVDSLTRDQLRGIYSGEITNWKQVGGNDEAILPYQRNLDSGSQNYMTEFMGDTPLIPAKSELVAGSMGGLMDVVAVYDNSSGAIGYSVYSYAAQMYANANKVKFISVDGVAPSKASMADESYPLLSCTYMIYTDRSPESARMFAGMALSDKGQQCVLESGYLPVNGMEIPASYLPYEAVGTGAPRPDGYKPSRQYCSFDPYLGGVDPPVVNTGKTFEVVFLKNKELQSRINADILNALDRLRDESFTPEWADNWCIDGVYFNSICENGYMSITLIRDNSGAGGAYSDKFDDAETLNYDLFSGKKIDKLSDLFYEGENFVPALNDNISERLTRYSEWYCNLTPKLDFSCVLGEPGLFTINRIGLEPGNPYLAESAFLYYSEPYDFSEFDLMSVVTQYRDMKPIIEDKWSSDIYTIDYKNEWFTKHFEEDGVTYLRVVGSLFHSDEEVRKRDELWYGLQKRAWELCAKSGSEWWRYGSVSLREGKNNYSVGHVVFAAGEDPIVHFDKDTLKILTIEDLIGKDWRQYLDENNKEFAELKLYPSEWMRNLEDASVMVYAFAEGRPHIISMRVPEEAMNKRYYVSDPGLNQ